MSMKMRIGDEPKQSETPSSGATSALLQIIQPDEGDAAVG
jgi:hypothetical protein